MTCRPSGAPTESPVERALVLAAGASSRIRAVAGDRPKPLIEVAGQSALERHLDQLRNAGVRDVWINLHYLGEQIVALIGDGSRYGVAVTYSWEQELLGTAGAARKLAAELARGTFLVVYGDNVNRLDYGALIARHREAGALATIAVFDRDTIPNTGLAGGRVVLDADDRILAFREGTESVSPWVNAGVYVLEPAVLGAIPAPPSDFGRDVFPSLIERGAHVQAYPVDGFCLGIDTPDGLARAEELLRDALTGARG